MKLKKIINQILGIKRNDFKFVHKHDMKNESMTPPICESLEGDEVNIIATNAQGELIVFNEKKEIKWSYKVDENIKEEEAMFLDTDKSNSINHTPLVIDIDNDGKKEIIFGTEYGSVCALNSKGKLIWKYSIDNSIRGGMSSFKVKESKIGIIFGASDKKIHILNAQGKPLRKIDNDSEIESTPLFYNNNIIFGDNSGTIKSIDFKGRINWWYKTKGKITAKPFLAKLNNGEEVLLIGSTDGAMYCLDMKGELKWKFNTKGSIYSEPAVLDINDDGLNEVIIGSSDGNVYVIDMLGNQIWNYQTDFWIIGKPVATDINKDGASEVIIGSYDNKVYVLTGKGLYVIEYVPGIAGIVAQNGNYSDIPSNSPGDIIGDKIWEYGTGGLVIGCASTKNQIIVQTKEGQIIWLEHQK